MFNNKTGRHKMHIPTYVIKMDNSPLLFKVYLNSLRQIELMDIMSGAFVNKPLSLNDFEKMLKA